MPKKTRLRTIFEKLVAYVKAIKLKSERVEKIEEVSQSVMSVGTNSGEDDAVLDEIDDAVDVVVHDGMDDDVDPSSNEDDAGGDDEPEIPDEPIRMVRLRRSRFPNRPSTIVFDYPDTMKGVNAREEHPEQRDRTEIVAVDKLLSSCASKTEQKADDNNECRFRLQFKSQWERNCIKNAFKQAGFERTEMSKKWSPEWSAAWIKQLPKRKYRKLASYQRINHFPDSWFIGNKSRLMGCIQGMQRKFGAPYQFVPEGYSWPDQRDDIMQTIAREPSSLWILKPPSSCCGKGIKVIQPEQLDTISLEKKMILQRYIANPLLIDDRKFDIRLYVLVTSMNPLRIYLFKEGLVRLCTAKYSLKPEDLENQFGHLTNYSVNKKNAAYQRNKSATQDGQGSKWSLKALYERLDADGITKDAELEIMTPIQDIVIKTMIAAEGHITPLVNKHVPHRNNCFELYGFDLMLDANLKPWLIEVNISPSLMGGSPLDRRIKGILVADLFNLVGFQFPTPEGETELTVNTSSEIKKGDSKEESKLPIWKSSSNVRSSSNTKDRDFADFQKIEQPSDKDWEMILDYEEEIERAGHFNCIFPTGDTLRNYQRFFTAPRSHNTVCGQWLRYKKKHRVSYRLSRLSENMASGLKSAITPPSPIKKVASASTLLSGSGPKQKVGFAIPFTPLLLLPN